VADIPGIERIRYTTSHPNEFTQRLIDVYAKVPQVGQPFAFAGAARLGPHIDGDETRLHRHGIQKHHPQTARGAPRHFHELAISLSASPAKPKKTSTRLMKLIDDIGFDAVVQLHLQPTSRHTRRQLA
jgi:tRNA-2-methylthio-N6-dimethylallyladenosine synthase